jgi:hypothetical protein
MKQETGTGKKDRKRKQALLQLRHSQGERFKIGDHELGRTRQEVPLSMMAFAYGVLVSFRSLARGAQKCSSSFPAYL